MIALPPFTLRCPRCGQPPLPGDRFCGACGSPVPASLLQAWRAWFTPKRVLWTVAIVGFVIMVCVQNAELAETPPPSTGDHAAVATDTASESTTTDDRAASGPRPAAVITADELLALTDRTLHACNRAGVKRAQWARVKSSKYGPVFEIHFAANDNFGHAAIRNMAALATFDVLNAIRKTVDIQTVARIRISATFSLTDKYGHAKEDDIMRLEFGRSTLTQLNWADITVSDQVFRAADDVWISPVIAD